MICRQIDSPLKLEEYFDPSNVASQALNMVRVKTRRIDCCEKMKKSGQSNDHPNRGTQSYRHSFVQFMNRKRKSISAGGDRSLLEVKSNPTLDTSWPMHKTTRGRTTCKYDQSRSTGGAKPTVPIAAVG